MRTLYGVRRRDGRRRMRRVIEIFLLLLASVAIFLEALVLPAVVAAAITGSTDGILFYTVFGLLAMALMAIDLSIGEWLAEREIRRNEETRRMKMKYSNPEYQALEQEFLARPDALCEQLCNY